MAKKLVILLIIFLALLAGVVIKVAKQDKYDIEEELQVKNILPENFLISNVSKLEIFNGLKPDKKVVISKKNGEWILEESYKAPGDSKKILKFLKKLKQLKGEYRPSRSQLLRDFKLRKKQALHLKIYHKFKTKNIVSHILVGKKDGYNACFVRSAYSNSVYRVGEELRSEVGIWGSSSKSEPKNKYWLNKTILKLNKNKVKKVILQYPDKELVFIREAIKSQKDKKDSIIKQPESFLDKKVSKKKKKKQYAWKLAKGGVLDKKIKQSTVKALLRNFEKFEGINVVDPKQKKKWGLTEATFKAVIELENNKKKVLVAGQPSLGNKGYCYLEDKPNIVYELNHWHFVKIFKKGVEFFKLPVYKIKTDQIKEVTLQTPDGTVSLRRIAAGKGKKKLFSWQLLSPKVNLAVSQNVADSIAKKLKLLKLDDYTDETNKAALGLIKSDHQVKVTMKDDSQHMIIVGKKSTSIDGYYCIVDEQKFIGTITSPVFTTLFPKFQKLLELELIDTKIDSFTIARAEESFSIKKEKNNWQFSDTKEKINANKIKEFCKQFKPLKASKVSFSQQKFDTKLLATIMVTSNKKKDTVQMYAKDKYGYPVRISDKTGKYWLDKKTGEILLKNKSYYIDKSGKK